MGLTSGILNLLLEETLNRTMPETLDDMKGVDNNLRNEKGRYSRLAAEDNSEDEQNGFQETDPASIFERVDEDEELIT